MNIQKFAKQEIALRQIETALELYFRQGDLFAVITLAGAAEEILGGLLQDRKGPKGRLSSVFRILRPGGGKGQRQEGFSGQFTGHELDAFVHLDPRHEAVFLLGRAVEDYVALAGTPSAGMLKFMSELSQGPG